jgi:hypothetical protein
MLKLIELKQLTILFASMTAIIFGAPLIWQITLSLLTNLSLSQQLIEFILGARIAAVFVCYIISSIIIAFIVFRSRLQVDSTKIKRQTIKLSATTALIVCALLLSMVLYTPMVKAETVSTTGQYLTLLSSQSDWHIGKLDTGTFFAINCSSMNDPVNVYLPFQPVAPWADFQTDSVGLTAKVFSEISYGTVYMKEVPLAPELFDDIPENVQVIENVNGLTRTFIKSANAQDGTYKINIDSVNPTYYTAQDNADRYIGNYISTNLSYTVNSVNDLMQGGTLKWTGSGSIYNTTNTLHIGSSTTYDVDYTWTADANVEIKLADDANCDVISNIRYGSGINAQLKIEKLIINGNKENNPSGGNGISWSVHQGEISECTIINCNGNGIQVNAPQSISDNNFHHNTIKNNTKAGIFFGTDTGSYGNGADDNIENNIIYYNGQDGIYCTDPDPIMKSNDIFSNGRHGVFLANIRYGSAMGNHISSNGQHNLLLYATSGFVENFAVIGNDFFGLASASNTYDHIRVASDTEAHIVTNCTFAGNNFEQSAGGNRRYAISFTTYCGLNSVSDNTFSGTFLNGTVSDYNHTNTYSDNIGFRTKNTGSFEGYGNGAPIVTHIDCPLVHVSVTSGNNTIFVDTGAWNFTGTTFTLKLLDKDGNALTGQNGTWSAEGKP